MGLGREAQFVEDNLDFYPQRIVNFGHNVVKSRVVISYTPNSII